MPTKINSGAILGNNIAHLQNTAKSGNKLWSGAPKRYITYAAVENNPVGTTSPYGQHVKFRIKDHNGIIGNITLKCKVKALAGSGGAYIRLVDYVGYNFLDQRLGVQIRDIANNTEIERIIPQEMYQKALFALDKEDAEVERELVLGELSDTQRNTNGTSKQQWALQLNHYSDLVHAKIPLHKTKAGLEIIFNIANQNDIVSTDHSSITAGLDFEEFELQVEYYELDEQHMRYVTEMMAKQNGIQFATQRLRILDETLSSGSTSYTVQVNQNKGLDYCQFMPFVVRPSADLSSSTDREYHNAIQLESYHYEENGKRIHKNDFDDYEYKNIYLANARVKNLKEVKSKNVYSYIFSHDLPLSLAKHANASGKRRPLGGHMFGEGNQELTLNFASALGANHVLSVFSYEEVIVRLSQDGMFYIM